MQRRSSSVIPNPTQEVILRAAFATEPEFSMWWDQCVQTIDPDKLDASTTTLLPLIQPKLTHVETSPLAKLCQIQYRKVWIHNELQLQRTKIILSELVKDGIRPILLKGAALLYQYYVDAGIRFMSDVDLLVKPSEYKRAVEIVLEFGFQPRTIHFPAVSLEFTKGVSFYHPRWKNFLDLHCRLFNCWIQESITEEYFNAAQSIELEASGKSIHCLTLCPTDQFFHVCSHGQIAGEHLHFRWVADALTIIENEKNLFDWKRLVHIAEQQGVSRFTWLALDYLKQVWDIDIPVHIINKIHQVSETPQQNHIYQIFYNDNRGRILQLMKRNWYVYRTVSAQLALVKQVSLFYRFLMHQCSAEHPLQLPYHFSEKFIRHFRYWLSAKSSNER